MKLNGILFDFNGTLIFDSDMHMEAFRRVFPMYGKKAPTTEEMISGLFGVPNRRIYAENFNPDFTEDELRRFIDLKENMYFDICLSAGNRFRLVDGAVEMLDGIKDMGIPYCLATGSDKESVEFFIRHLGLDRWFTWDNIVYENGSFKGKPEPDIYHIAARKIGLSPTECLVFEDGTSGIRAANAAGAGAVIAVYDKKYPSPLTEGAHADKVLHDHLEWKQTLAEYGLLR